MTEEIMNQNINALGSSLISEFIGSSFTKIFFKNNFQTLKKETVSILIELNLEIEIEIICGLNFPQEYPFVFALEPIKSDIVNILTNEINYNSFYNWAKKSTLLQLTKVIQEYFMSVPFEINQSIRNIFRQKKKIIENYELFFNEDLKKLIENKLVGKNDRKNNEKISLEILKVKTPKILEILEKVNLMVDFGLKVEGEIESERIYLGIIKETAISNIIEFKLAKMRIYDMRKNLKIEKKVFLKENESG